LIQIKKTSGWAVYALCHRGVTGVLLLAFAIPIAFLSTEWNWIARFESSFTAELQAYRNDMDPLR